MFDTIVHHHHHGVPPEVRKQLDRIDIAVSQINARSLKIMSDQEDLKQSVDAIELTVEAVATELVELSAALAGAIAANDMTLVRDAKLRIDALRVKLADIGTSVDITPETPVPGGTPASPPVEEPPAETP